MTPRIATPPPATLLNRIAGIYSRRRFGRALAPLEVMGHNARILRAHGAFERALERAHSLDERLKTLAVMASAVRLGCAWCVDFGHWFAVSQGIDEETLRAVPGWRESDTFSPLERDVMDYAELMTDDPAAITDAQVDGLRRALGEEALVELTYIVAVENMRSRFNTAMGLIGQGFSEACALGPAR